MANGMTIDKLYEAFMDIDEFGDPSDPTPFAEDVFTFFGKDTLADLGKEEWAAQYGMYLPTFDPAQTYLAERERDLDYRSAMDTLQTTQAATERVYATEMDTLSTSLGRELGKGREIAGRTGIRSGDLEVAIQDTIATTGSKAKDFGDRVRISEEEIDNTYNNAMVDAALDFDKAERQEKEEFYDRTMAAIMRLMDKDAFDDPTEEPNPCADALVGSYDCGGGECASDECDCSYNQGEGALNPACLSEAPPDAQITQDCASLCVGVPGTSGGMSCSQTCAGAGGTFDPHVWMQMAQTEADAGCEYGAEWVGGQWVCAGGDDIYNPCAGVTGCAFNYASGNCQDVHGNACDCNCA